MTTPNTAEDCVAKIPALQTLIALGWRYVPAKVCMAMRSGNHEVILRGVLIDELRKRRFEYRGQSYSLSTNAIEQIVRELASPGLQEGLLTANERLYNAMTLGVTVTEFIDGKKQNL